MVAWVLKVVVGHSTDDTAYQSGYWLGVAESSLIKAAATDIFPSQQPNFTHRAQIIRSISSLKLSLAHCLSGISLKISWSIRTLIRTIGRGVASCGSLLSDWSMASSPSLSQIRTAI